MTSTRQNNARIKILDIAEQSVLDKGFTATSIDEIVAEAGITKSGFFYHFNDKNSLAKALLTRYQETEEKLFDDIFIEKAGRLHDDPLHRFLIGLNIMAEMMDELESHHPGCLVATYCYQERSFNHDVIQLNKDIVFSWRNRFHKTLTEIAEKYPPKEEVDLEDLADMLLTVIEGGIVISKSIHSESLLGKQIRLYRNYLKQLFM